MSPTPGPRTRSPIKEPPQRRPGQGLEERIERRGQRWFFLAGASCASVLAAGVAWVALIAGHASSHWVLTALAVAATAWTALTIRGEWPTMRRMFLGARGERHVADLLDELRERGYRLVHDLPIVRDGRTRANVDHVLIGPSGVFAIESKARTKPTGVGSRAAEVRWDGDRLLVAGQEQDRDPVAQARNAAADVRRLIHARTGRDWSVRAVVLFPGWFVRERSGSEVWVLGPKRLFAWLRREEREAARAGRSLPPGDIAAITASLVEASREAPQPEA